MANIGYAGTGTNPPINMTGIGSLRAAQVEAPGFEMGRSARSFVGGMTLKAGGIAGVVDTPTTTGPMILFNSSSQGQGGRVLVVKKISAWYASASMGVYGFSTFGGVTPSVLATPLVANGATNFRVAATRGYGTSLAFIDVAKTVAQPTWMLLGGMTTTSQTVMGNGYIVDLSAHPFIVPPLFAFACGVIADTTGSGLFGLSLAWDEVEATLP